MREAHLTWLTHGKFAERITTATFCAQLRNQGGCKALEHCLSLPAPVAQQIRYQYWTIRTPLAQTPIQFIKQENSYKGSPRSDRSRLYAAGNLVGVSYAPRNAECCSSMSREEEQGRESTSDTEKHGHRCRPCHSGVVHHRYPICICCTLSIDHAMSPCRETDSAREAGYTCNDLLFPATVVVSAIWP